MAIYAGIGSRRTPSGVLQDMMKFAEVMAIRGWILRTGYAPGADQAFWKGARIGRRSGTQVLLPWDRFRGYVDGDGLVVTDQPSHEKALEIASEYHPVWSQLDWPARQLHARNVMIMLGPDLQQAVDFVICWTREGRLEGGTSQCLRMALDRGIPIFNLGDDQRGSWKDFSRLNKLVTKVP